MNGNDLIKVLKELRVYAQSWNNVSHKDFTCQTDFPEADDNNNIPAFYCCQFSSSGDAETQCDIPVSQGLCKICAKSLSVENASTQCNLLQETDNNFKLLPKGNLKNNEIIFEEVKEDFSSIDVPLFPSIDVSLVPRLSEPSGHSGSTVSLDLSDHKGIHVAPEQQIGQHQTNLKTSLPGSGKNDSQAQQPTLTKVEVNTYDDLEDCEDNQTFEHMDDDDPEEIHIPEKYGIPEINEEEKQFWAEMKKKSRRIKLKSKHKYKKNGSIKKNTNCELSLPSTKVHIKEEKDKDTDDAEWLTDDEEDDDLPEDFTVVFKDEWKKKRVPANTHEKNYICDVCNKPYSKSHLLREHIVREHSDHDKAKEYPFRCHHCKRVYLGQRQLDYHQSKHNGPCEICGMMFGCSGLFWNHRKNHDAECDVCGKSFSTVNTLFQHKKFIHGKQKHFCNICDKGFAYKSLLKMHKDKAHAWRSDGKPFGNKRVEGSMQDLTCEECRYVAKNMQSLKVHQGMAHRRKKKKIEDKFYSCGVCEAKLTSKSILKKHLDKHVTTYPSNKCNICNKLFSTEKKLVAHRRKIHGLVIDEEETQELHIISEDRDVHPCNICELSFDSSHALQEHMLSVHSIPKRINIITDRNQIIYDCAYCSGSFDSSSSLQTHILSVHAVSREIVQAASESLQVATTVEEYPVMEISLSNREIGSPEKRIISETFEIPVETSVSTFDTTTTVSLPASAVPADVSTVEIDGIKYHVIRNDR